MKGKKVAVILIIIVLAIFTAYIIYIEVKPIEVKSGFQGLIQQYISLGFKSGNVILPVEVVNKTAEK